MLLSTPEVLSMEKKKSLTDYEKKAQQRFLELIDEFAGGSKIEFARITNINQGSVSQYCNGKNTPSSFTAEKIRDAFGINPVWIMGFDVPKYVPDESYDFMQAQYGRWTLLWDIYTKWGYEYFNIVSVYSQLSKDEQKMIFDMIQLYKDKNKIKVPSVEEMERLWEKS